jgi:hypothetical protein
MLVLLWLWSVPLLLLLVLLLELPVLLQRWQEVLLLWALLELLVLWWGQTPLLSL